MTEITWYKRFHGTAYDPKFTAAAIEAESDHCHALGVWDALLETTSDREEDRGSLAKIDLRVVAAGLHLAIDEVRRIWDAFISLGMIAGERVAKWAKRQGAAVAKLAQATVSAGAVRTRRWRQKKAVDPRQTEMLFAISGNASSVTSQASPSVTATVTLAADSEGESKREDSSFIKKEVGASGRDAPLGDAAPPTPTEMLIAALADPVSAGLIKAHTPEQKQAIKLKKKEARRGKCFRYITARFDTEGRAKRISGMMGLDPDHDEQWWFDHVDQEMRCDGWDDTRDIANDNRWRAAA